MMKRFVKKAVSGCLIVMSVFLPICVNMVSGDDKVRGKKNYSDRYNGRVGTYVSTGTENTVKTSMVSASKITTNCNIYLMRYNYNTGTYDADRSLHKVDIEPGETKVIRMVRSYQSAVYDYYHGAENYASKSHNSATLIDSYKFIAMQYYR